MNSTLFLCSLLPISTFSGDINWIIDDDSDHYNLTDMLDISQDLLGQVYAIYEESYRPYAKEYRQNMLISEPNGLYKYNRWILIYEDSDPNKKPICMVLFKTTEYGLKSGLMGSNGIKEAKKALILFKISSFNTQRVFGEISGALEERIIADVPIVTFENAKKILSKFGKKDVNQVDENHYSRCIGNLGIVTKIMVGIPLLK